MSQSQRPGHRLLVAVVGATGDQGGGCVQALLRQGSCDIRAITRNTDSAAARRLRQKGIDTVTGDLNDTNSLIKAFHGAFGVFLITDSASAAYDPCQEIAQGLTAVDAAREAGVSYVVFSGHEDCKQHIQEFKSRGMLPAVDGFYIPLLEPKAVVAEHLRASGGRHAVLVTGMFYQNWIKRMNYRLQPDGSFTVTSNAGSCKIPMHDAMDAGATAAVIFQDPEKHLGQLVPVNAGSLTMAEACEIVSEATGKLVRFKNVTDEEVRAIGTSAAMASANMWQYWRDMPHAKAVRDQARALYQGQGFREWAGQHAAEIVEQLNACCRH